MFMQFLLVLRAFQTLAGPEHSNLAAKMVARSALRLFLFLRPLLRLHAILVIAPRQARV